MKIAFLLERIEEARIIRGYFQEKGHEVAVYNNPNDILGLRFIPDILVVDIKCISNQNDLRLVLSSSQRILFILPFWENAGKKVENLRSKAKLFGLKKIKIKVIKRPFTPEELLNFIQSTFQI